ncbi:PilZ domain-containing protein [Yoonia sp. BS5-3]|uniref:PilZ domain-containing protein n=1 Tax=Yoonia phaeophyticola TaxID=3137369 RepID=A0ABZ2V1F5_9RHOB
MAFATSVVDRRSARRYTGFAVARVRTKTFDFSCRVVDISATGAKIGVAPSLISSFREDEWDLVIDRIGRLRAKKIWQRGSEFGLQFVTSAGKKASLENTLNSLADAGTIRLLDG